jgi:hypothetical protein
MRWVRDETGRLPRRPHFEAQEIDRECESMVAAFLQRKYGEVRYPLSTDDLTVLVEQETRDLDLYADFPTSDPLTEGVTEFAPPQRPRVLISARLSESAGLENRLRTTLAHELGHVRLHNCLWTLDAPLDPRRLSPRCRRATILGGGTDWLEWQAGYASGAVLMPLGALQRVVAPVIEQGRLRPPVFVATTAASRLVRRVQRSFQVSATAAQVRLLQLGYLTKRRPGALPMALTASRTRG